MRFNDGVVIRTDGELRIVRRFDGYYLVGRGMCIPVESYEAGVELKESMQ